MPMAVSSPSGGLHLLRSTVQLVRVIMENTGPGDLVIWVADEDQLPDWARRALERLLMTGQGFEKNRVISEVVTVERLITAKLGFDAPPIDRPLR